MQVENEPHSDDDVWPGHPTDTCKGTALHTHAVDVGMTSSQSLHHHFECCHWLQISWFLVCSTAYDLRCLPCLRVCSSNQSCAFCFLSPNLVFRSSISHVRDLTFVFNPYPHRQRVCAVQCPCRCRWVALAVHHHLVVQNGILGLWFSFFSIFCVCFLGVCFFVSVTRHT